MRLRHQTLLLLALAVPALAQDDDRPGRIRYLEPGVTLQRGTEAGSEEAVANLPFVPGDRVWTDAAGRAEFQFEDGSLVRLDSRSKLDYAGRDEGRDDRVVLRLWSGGLIALVRDGRRRMTFAIETPGGLVEASKRGLYRVDVDSREVRLSVYDGQASLDTGRRRIDVDAGERVYARRGENPEPPQRFDRAEQDDFARWNDDRERREGWAVGSRRYLPDELDPYAGDFESNGTWYYETEVGYVWRPFVAGGWSPYRNGRWAWTSYGWTWCPNEAWGWAPFHYGRWGFSGALGWYWVPGRVWGPGWVSWAVAGDYVGWCPLGSRDRAVVTAPGRVQGYAVPRGRTGEPAGWSFVRRADVGARDLARRRVEAVPDAALGELRVADSARLRPTRDVRDLREVAVPRAVRTKPTPGDFVPELAVDRETTIPAPWVNRRTRPTGREDVPHWSRQETPDLAATRPAAEGEATERPADHPTDARSPVQSRPVPSGALPRVKEREEHAGKPDPGSRSERDREVLRPLFRPLSEPRPRSGGNDDEARPRDDGRARDSGQARPREAAPSGGRDQGSSRGESAPPRSEPRATPPPRTESHGDAPKASPPPPREHATPRHKPDRE